jgi:hypothetical protein
LKDYEGDVNITFYNEGDVNITFQYEGDEHSNMKDMLT